MFTKFTKDNPYIASIVDRFSLCADDSGKETHHITLDMGESGITYEVGDSVAIFAANDPVAVDRLLARIKGLGELQAPGLSAAGSWREFFSKKVELSTITRKFLQTICDQLTGEKKDQLQNILDQSALFKEFQASHEVLEVLDLYPEVSMTGEEMSLLLKPMMPRFYSIASSQKAVGSKIDLTVALQKWEVNGKPRVGVCTKYLCHLAPLGEPVVPIYIHPHRGFTLPEDREAPIIMVGPGTGVAPFRAFMQERSSLVGSGKSWLFFGEWNRDKHFFYEDFWKELEREGNFRFDAAFSRDQESKVYVQNLMMEKGRDLFQWLEEGAYFFVCGDAKNMARDVEEALHRIVQECGGRSDIEAAEYVKMLRQQKRYIKDVY